VPCIIGRTPTTNAVMSVSLVPSRTQIHASVVVCWYMRVAGAVIHVMRGRSWLEDLRTDNKYTICTLGKFVTTYPTGRSHSGFYIYKESKSRLGPRKCAIPFSPAFRFISWAIKCEEEDKENHIIFYFVF
jgi:hypothetical protein